MDSSNVADRGGSEADHTGIIYKYTDQNGAEKILSTRTLRFARPSEMNDPFDVYIEDLLGMDLEEVHEPNIDILQAPTREISQ